MGRRAKPAKGTAEAKRPFAGKTPKDEGAKVRGLEKRLTESLERERATSEILGVISSPPTDAQPVFDAIAKRPMQLCDASPSGVLRFDAELVHIVALGNVNP